MNYKDTLRYQLRFLLYSAKSELKNFEEFLVALLSRFEDHSNEERKADKEG